ncbi:hypothetical protein DFH09DRAFT_1081303 [Mycena vulgaris]|nr:hypothetical protein DFH09DRAFT_1081303 [Mycena vulgaris]
MFDGRNIPQRNPATRVCDGHFGRRKHAKKWDKLPVNSAEAPKTKEEHYNWLAFGGRLSGDSSVGRAASAGWGPRPGRGWIVTMHIIAVIGSDGVAIVMSIARRTN